MLADAKRGQFFRISIQLVVNHCSISIIVSSQEQRYMQCMHTHSQASKNQLKLDYAKCGKTASQFPLESKWQSTYRVKLYTVDWRKSQI